MKNTLEGMDISFENKQDWKSFVDSLKGEK